MPERIDLPAFAAAFGRALHEAGVPVTPERSAAFARAVALAPPASRSRLYWTARAVFVSSHEQLSRFDSVFSWIFDGLSDPADARGDPAAPPLAGEVPGGRGSRSAADRVDLPGARGPAAPAGDLRSSSDDASGEARDIPVAAASYEERLSERDFASLEPHELRALVRLMRELALAPPLRLLRRSRRDPHGARLDLRATLRASRRTAGDPVRRVMRRRVAKPRRLVVLCDISGSMEPYARAYLQFLHAAVGGADAEAFVFATRLTRLTRALRGRQPQLAIERASAAAHDWSSGTRLGESLKRFNDLHGRRGMARGAVIVIISDGWERGESALLAREMQRLRRLAHRIVWVNPRKAARDFVPLVGGMAAALPYCDAFVSGHSVAALHEVASAVAMDDD
jgi:uncharacterized protein with von Willebrand factor type A (vWA) domain